MRRWSAAVRSGRIPHWTIPLAAGLVWVLLIGIGAPMLQRARRATAPARGARVLAAPQAFASVTLPRTRGVEAAGSAVAVPPAPPVGPAKRTALVIGVNRAAGHSTLQGAVTDATNLQTALVQYGFPEANVVTLTDGAATASRILTELDALAARATADGRAVFSFAGHTELRGGVPHFVTSDGGLIPARTVAAKLARVRAPLWVALPTCYAGGYALPGIIGPNRVATFSSSANKKSYELGPAGSWLMLYMVEYGMLERQAPRSVESAFAYARKAIADVNPDRQPFMVDNFRGDFVLGSLRSDYSATGGGPTEPTNGDGVSGSPPSAGAETEGSTGPDRGPVRICGDVSFGCNK